MFKKIIIGTLVLIVVSTSSVVVHAAPQDELNIDAREINIELEDINVEASEEEMETVQIISPQISPEGEVIVDKNLLISVNVLEESNVTLSVYKVLKVAKSSEEAVKGEEDEKFVESLELVFDSVVIEPSDELEADFVKHIKDVEPGIYRMVFEKGTNEDPKIIEFEVKKTEEVVNEENVNVLPKLLDLSITDLLLEE